MQLVFFQAGKRHYLSTGLADKKLNPKAAEAKVLLTETDIVCDRFDSTLAKYKPQPALSTIILILDAIQIRYYLVKKLTPNAPKRCLRKLSACCNWAIKSVADKNPFAGIVATLKLPKAQAKDDDINLTA